MDNLITIKLKENKDGAHDYKIEFESNPTLSELCTCMILFQQITSRNFGTQDILTKMSSVYHRLEDVEEVKRT